MSKEAAATDKDMTMKSLLIAGCLAVLATVSLAEASIDRVINTATGLPGLPAGGALATIFLSGLSDPPINLASGKYVASGLPLPFQLGGVKVTFYDGEVLAPILSVTVPPPGSSNDTEVVFQVPAERNVSLYEQYAPGDVAVFVYGPGGSTHWILSPLPKPTTGGFFGDADRYALAQHAADYSPVTVSNPAHAGESIIAYADDLFGVWPEPPMGVPAPAQPVITDVLDAGTFSLYLQTYPPLTAPDPISHQGGGYFPATPPLTTTFLGLAPGQVGIQQINFTVPANQQPGDWALFYANGYGIASPYVLIPVR